MTILGRRPFLQSVATWTGLAAATRASAAAESPHPRSSAALLSMFKPGVRYRMPAVFGPAPGPRQKGDGTQWKPEETGTMNSHSITVRYLTQRAKLLALLPPGFSLRGDPVVSVSFSYFGNLYWLAGRGYGIVGVRFPVVYTGKTETITGTFCPVMWEGIPDAILTGREELGFPKLFADISQISYDAQQGTASGNATWFGHKFVEIEARGLTEVPAPAAQSDGASLFLKYMPRTSVSGKEGADIAYVTTSQPVPGTAGSASPINLSGVKNYKRWTTQSGSVLWRRATFEQLPTTYHVINGLANLDVVSYLGAEMTQYSAPGISVWANGMRAVEPA